MNYLVLRVDRNDTSYGISYLTYLLAHDTHRPFVGLPWKAFGHRFNFCSSLYFRMNGGGLLPSGLSFLFWACNILAYSSLPHAIFFCDLYILLLHASFRYPWIGSRPTKDHAIANTSRCKPAAYGVRIR